MILMLALEVYLRQKKFQEMITESSNSIEIGSERTTHMNNPPQNEVKDIENPVIESNEKN